MNNDPIYVTKTFLPPIEEYTEFLKDIWESGQVTNQGSLIKELQYRLEEYLGLVNLQVVTNGTIALQIAFKALEIEEGEVITTPFSYVASTSSILWEKLKPVFVDIDEDTLCIDAEKIEAAITPKTRAIMAVHVFGIPCDVEAIEVIAKKHDLKVIYDAAHAFGVRYKGQSLLSYGDVSTCSFHATKLFHTIEGGAVIARDKKVTEKLDLIKRFGHHGDDHIMLGINAKATEFNAAMGLCNLKYIDQIIVDRKRASESYDNLLSGRFKKPYIPNDVDYNYSYYPVIFSSEQELLSIKKRLEENNIYPRRYFYPSLNTLPYLEERLDCPISEDISKRILCLPIYFQIKESVIEQICQALNS